MQIVGEKDVRIIPDIIVGQGGEGNMVDALLGVMLQQQLEDKIQPTQTINGGSGGKRNLPGSRNRPGTLPGNKDQ